MVSNINKNSMLKTGALLHGTYRIDGYLSSGGFGNTYVVTHINFNEHYALKEFFMSGVCERDGNNTTVSVSNADRVTEFIEQMEKFKKEAQRLRLFTNDHIVRVHDLFEENGTAYYVMDFINGENFKDRLARTRKPMTEQEVTNVLRQVLDALQAVHNQGLWHLDLKPANVMVDSNGVIKLIDFGASKQFNNKTGGAMSTSAVTFTNGYAPIEQMERSYEKFGPWTDFYALGATIYNLLTNKKPPMPSYINDDNTPDKRVALPMPNGISAPMRYLVRWMMRPNRQERPANVQQIVDFLNNPNDYQQQISADNGDTVISGAGINQMYTPASSKKSGNKWLIPAIVAALVVGLGIALAALLANRGSSDGEGEDVDSTAVVEAAPAPLQVENLKVSIPLAQDGCTYTGAVNEDSIPDGVGEVVFANGDKCSGTFVNGDITGDDITYEFYDGDVFYGTFQNNGFYKGKYTQSDGTYFVGTFKDNVPDKGQWYDKNGNKIQR